MNATFKLITAACSVGLVNLGIAVGRRFLSPREIKLPDGAHELHHRDSILWDSVEYRDKRLKKQCVYSIRPVILCKENVKFNYEVMMSRMKIYKERELQLSRPETFYVLLAHHYYEVYFNDDEKLSLYKECYNNYIEIHNKFYGKPKQGTDGEKNNE